MEHGDAAASEPDDAGCPQLRRGCRNRLAPHAEQVGNPLVCGRDLAAGQAVEAKQQPPAELLRDSMVPAADGGLRNLRDQRLREPQEQSL